MGKEYLLLSKGKVLYEYGYYNEEDAQKIAQSVARKHPGEEVLVVRILHKYEFAKKGTGHGQP